LPKRDYYDTLNVPRNATKEQIKNEYRKLALKYHPDRNKSPDAEERFKEISEAYAILWDDEKRAQYDRFGHAGIDAQYSPEDIFRGIDFDEILRDLGFGFGGVESIFDTFFGGGRRARGPVRGQDIRYDLEISLEQAYSGLTTEIEVPRVSGVRNATARAPSQVLRLRNVQSAEAPARFNTCKFRGSCTSPV
jgi:molecular chaperone DnaJ